MDLSENSTKTPPSWLTKGAFFTSIMALLVSGTLAIRFHDARTALDQFSEMLETEKRLLAEMQAAHDEDIKKLHANAVKIGQLTDQVFELETLLFNSATGNHALAAEVNATNEPSKTISTPPNKTEPRRYTHFDVPQAGVEVWQNEKGRIQVRNQDASLTGKVITVLASDEAGNQRVLSIAIPAPRN